MSVHPESYSSHQNEEYPGTHPPHNAMGDALFDPNVQTALDVSVFDEDLGLSQRVAGHLERAGLPRAREIFIAGKQSLLGVPASSRRNFNRGTQSKVAESLAHIPISFDQMPTAADVATFCPTLNQVGATAIFRNVIGADANIRHSVTLDTYLAGDIRPEDLKFHMTDAESMHITTDEEQVRRTYEQTVTEVLGFLDEFYDAHDQLLPPTEKQREQRISALGHAAILLKGIAENGPRWEVKAPGPSTPLQKRGAVGLLRSTTQRELDRELLLPEGDAPILKERGITTPRDCLIVGRAGILDIDADSNTMMLLTRGMGGMTTLPTPTAAEVALFCTHLNQVKIRTFMQRAGVPNVDFRVPPGAPEPTLSHFKKYPQHIAAMLGAGETPESRGLLTAMVRFVKDFDKAAAHYER